MRLAQPLENLIDQLLKLPTIGPKSAQRLALYIIKQPPEEARQLADAILNAKVKIFPCSTCGYLTDIDPCIICRDETRDPTVICVAEEASDIIAIDRTGFRGKYFVLNRQFNLLDNSQLDNMDLKPLTDRLAAGTVKEVVLALNPDIDGEVMSRFIAGLAEQYGVKVTRLAHGIPVGGSIEFTDEITLRKALEGRKEF
ncbi:MAG TPA: recombination mediator RecR [Syntrophomonadaceae bacterium]|nr:recombination mediator RecR [Syntrophomonadaceae bacterium]